MEDPEAEMPDDTLAPADDKEFEMLEAALSMLEMEAEAADAIEDASVGEPLPLVVVIVVTTTPVPLAVEVGEEPPPEPPPGAAVDWLPPDPPPVVVGAGPSCLPVLQFVPKGQQPLTPLKEPQ